MLNENQLEALAQRFYERMQKVNEQYLTAIGKRFEQLGFISASDQGRLTRLMEWSLTDAPKIQALLVEATNKSVDDIRDTLEVIAQDNYDFAEPYYTAQAVDYVKYADNLALVGLVEGIIKETQGTLENISSTTSVQSIYRDALDKASIKANMGLESYSTAIREVMREVAEKGIYYVDYASGHKRRLDTSVRQNILYAMKRTNLESAELIGDQFGNDGWEISYHSNPRPSHVSMGGKQYSLEQFQKQGIANLLNDYNCRHYKYAIVLGVSEPAFDKEELAKLKELDESTFTYKGKEMTRYEASQEQRKLETAIRKQKDLAVIAKASNNMPLRREVQAKINALNSEYVKLSNAADLPYRADRLSVAGFRQVKAVETVRKGLQKDKKRLIINESKKDLFANVPNEEYKKVVQDRFDSGSDDIKSLYEKYVPIAGAVKSYNYKSTAHYSPFYNIINLDLEKDIVNLRGKGTTFFHEYGHYIDNALSDVSKNADFINAIKNDVKVYENSVKKTVGTISQARIEIANDFRTDIHTTHSIQDIFGGAIKKPYGWGLYHHSSSYWKRDPDRTLGAEAFAHMFEASFSTDKQKYFEKYLPTSWALFQRILKEL